MLRAYAEAQSSALELLDAQMRDAVRREGVDPQRDGAAVRRIAEQVTAAYDQRSLSGAVPALDDRGQVVTELLARVAGFGPLQRYFDDPSVEEVWINDPSRVFVARDGRHELTTTILTAEQVRDLVERLLKTSGRRADLSKPFVDAMLPNGNRVHVVLEGISRDFIAVNIRKFIVKASRLGELVELGSMPPAASRFRDAAVVSGLNILVSGGTQPNTKQVRCAQPGRPNPSNMAPWRTRG